MSLKQEVDRYSKLNGYDISSYRDLACSCGNEEFYLHSDDEEGGAYAVCITCNSEHDIMKSRTYIENSLHNICSCDSEILKIGVGTSHYPDTSDVRWVYVGAHCEKCGLNGVYADWKEG